MNLWAYIAKRLLLMLPTVIGVISITFAVIQFVPGGPVEQALMELKAGPALAKRPAAARRNIAAGKASMPNAWRRSRRCTVSTSRRRSVSGKC